MKSLNYVFKYYLNFLLKFAGPITLDTRAYNGSLPTLSLNPYAYTKVRKNKYIVIMFFFFLFADKFNITTH